MSAASSPRLSPRNIAAFVLISLIWGSTWLVIRDQISAVPPQWSIAYRFVVAAIGMFALAAFKRESLAVPRDSMRWVILLALTQFVLNFTFVYRAEHYITSGLVAVVFALLIVPNTLLGRIFLGQKITRPFVMGSAIACFGIGILFYHEYRAMPASLSDIMWGVGLSCLGLLSASGANIIQATEGAKRIPILTLLAWAMAMGALINGAIAWVFYGAPQFDMRPSYGFGIAYLGLIGSVATFPLYYGLIRDIGAGKAAYSGVIVPLVAMALSTMFEGYVWSALSILGAGLTLAGMVVAMTARKPSK